MTWGGTAARLSGLLILLPLVMTKFSVAETALWFLFSTVLSLQTLVDFGFSATFVRFVAYSKSAKVGAAPKVNGAGYSRIPQQSNSAVIANMRYVYTRLSAIWFILLAVVGSLAVARPIANIDAPLIGWIAWGIIAVTSGIFFRGAMHISYLQGMERVALHQRWEIILGLCTTVVGCLVLVAGGGILELTIVNQLGGLARFFLYRNLAVKLAPARAWEKVDNSMTDKLWSAVWRSGLGVLATFGTIQLSGVVYAQLASPGKMASYLLALQLIRRVRQFSYVPFYTRIPDMSRMYATGEHKTLVCVADKSMQLSAWVFIALVLIIGFSGNYLLELINSSTSFVAVEVWWLLALAFFFELIGATHIQLYSTTNHIVWHIANGVSGLIMLAVMPLAFSLFGVIGLPLGMLVGYACFYVPYSMMLSYRKFDILINGKNILSMVGPVLILVILLVFQEL